MSGVTIPVNVTTAVVGYGDHVTIESHRSAMDALRTKTIEECAKVAEGMAADQERTNAKYPEHAKAYATWRNAVHCYNDVARQIRKLTITSGHHNCKTEI